MFLSKDMRLGTWSQERFVHLNVIFELQLKRRRSMQKWSNNKQMSLRGLQQRRKFCCSESMQLCYHFNSASDQLFYFRPKRQHEEEEDGTHENGDAGSSPSRPETTAAKKRKANEVDIADRVSALFISLYSQLHPHHLTTASSRFLWSSNCSGPKVQKDERFDDVNGFADIPHILSVQRRQFSSRTETRKGVIIFVVQGKSIGQILLLFTLV